MSNEIKKLFEKLESKFSDLKMMALTTVDGFPLYSHVISGASVAEESKIAAVTSSLASLSDAAARQLIGSELQGTVIEMNSGYMILVNTKYDGKKCVLCVASGDRQNLGNVRYFTHKLAEYISKQ